MISHPKKILIELFLGSFSTEMGADHFISPQIIPPKDCGITMNHVLLRWNSLRDMAATSSDVVILGLDKCSCAHC